jgi:drug/metabolite transporter (DMT)-like permease
MLWVPITLAAAAFQVLRTAQQHQLRAHLSPAAAGFVRYLYGAPFAWLIGAVWFGALGHDLPAVPGRFWPLVTLAGVAQLGATVALLRAFRERDFAVGTVYSKTEVLAVTIAGAVGLREPLAPSGWIGVVLVTAGVVWLAARGSPSRLLRRAGDRAALLGLAAGTLFAITSVLIRGTSSTMPDTAPAFDRALVTLIAMLTIQTVLNTAGFAVVDPTALPKALTAWRPAVVVGVLSLLGSMGWAWAMTLENAAKVRTLGQVELLIAFVVARVRLGDRHTRVEYVASALVLVGVVVVTIAG